MAGREDPLRVFSFAAEFGSHLKGAFSECSVVSAEHEVIEKWQTDSTGKPVYIALPGKVKQGHITLKRSITSNNDAWKWRKMVEDGNVEGARTNGSIKMYDHKGALKLQVDVINAWPTKVSGPTPNSSGNEAAVEEIDIVVEGLTRSK